MYRDLRLVQYLLAVLCIALFIGSCSGGDIPFVPGSDGPTQGPTAPRESQVHQCWGLYDILISADRSQWDIVPRREGISHMNILPLLEGTPPNLTIPENGIVLKDTYIEATVNLTHPLTGLTGASFWRGFDVKGIIMFPGTYSFPTTGVTTQDFLGGEGRVLNADGFSRWWNPTEFTTGIFLQSYVEGKMGLFPGQSSLINATIHPFKWLTTAARHSFPPGTTAQAVYNLVLPATGETLALMYAVDVSYGVPTLKPVDNPDPEFKLKHFETSANQPEPYGVTVNNSVNTMWADGNYEGGGSVVLDITVFDWQDPRFFNNTPMKDRGVLKPYIEVPGLFDEDLKFELAANNPNPVAHATTTAQVSTGMLPEDFIVINGATVPYPPSFTDNTSMQNADHICTAINFVAATNVKATAVQPGLINLEQMSGGANNRIEIIVTANLSILGLDTLDNATYNLGTPPYYLVENGLDTQNWTVTIPNSKAIIPGDYPALIVTPDFTTDPLFPGAGKVEAYWMLTLNVVETKPFLCDNNQAVHSTVAGGGWMDGGAMEYRADCDFIGYPGSPYYGKLLVNRRTNMADGGVQEIAVINVDHTGPASPQTLITISSEKRGIPLVLQEDPLTGNIIVVNNTDQDAIFVFSYLGQSLNMFDNVGTGDNGYNSPIALDFDEYGAMWIISHRGSAGPELRHWIKSPQGDGSYIHDAASYVDLAPIFGHGRNIMDMKIMPSQKYMIIFTNTDKGRLEFFDYSQTPPAQVTALTMLGVFGTGITPVNYPGLRIAGGGSIILDAADPDLTKCRIVVVANLLTGPVGLQKIDFVGNKLGAAFLPSSTGELTFAINNDPVTGLRDIIAFPISLNNTYTLYAPPPTW